MKQLVTLILTLMFITPLMIKAQAPALDWENNLGGSKWDLAQAIEQATES